MQIIVLSHSLGLVVCPRHRLCLHLDEAALLRGQEPLPLGAHVGHGTLNDVYPLPDTTVLVAGFIEALEGQWAIGVERLGNCRRPVILLYQVSTDLVGHLLSHLCALQHSRRELVRVLRAIVVVIAWIVVLSDLDSFLRVLIVEDIDVQIDAQIQRQLFVLFRLRQHRLNIQLGYGLLFRALPRRCFGLRIWDGQVVQFRFRLGLHFRNCKHVLENFQILLQSPDIDNLTALLLRCWLARAQILGVLDPLRFKRCIAGHFVDRLDFFIDLLHLAAELLILIIASLDVEDRVISILPFDFLAAEGTLNMIRRDVLGARVFLVRAEVNFEIQRPIVGKRADVELFLAAIPRRHFIQAHQRLAEAVLFSLLRHPDLVEHSLPLLVRHGTAAAFRICLADSPFDARLRKLTLNIIPCPVVLLSQVCVTVGHGRVVVVSRQTTRLVIGVEHGLGLSLAGSFPLRLQLPTSGVVVSGSAAFYNPGLRQVTVVVDHAHAINRACDFARPRTFEVDVGDSTTGGHCDAVGALEPPLLHCILLDFDLLQDLITLLLVISLLLFDEFGVYFVGKDLVLVEILEVLKALLVG